LVPEGDQAYILITRSEVGVQKEIYTYNSHKTESVSLRKCLYDHWLTNKVYLSAIIVTSIFQSFTCKMAAKTSWHGYGTKLRHCHCMYTRARYYCEGGCRRGNFHDTRTIDIVIALYCRPRIVSLSRKDVSATRRSIMTIVAQ